MAEGTIDFERLTRQLLMLLRAEGISVEQILLYGSHAEGHPRPDSDIDIVVIGRGLERFDPIARLEFLSKIAWQCEGPVELLGYTPEETEGQAGKSILWDEVCQSGRSLYQ